MARIAHAPTGLSFLFVLHYNQRMLTSFQAVIGFLTKPHRKEKSV